ncbi:MAG TPA: hypothetical protein VFA96_02705 [Nocardioides sp.]|nr:hypothetical protein [Nocardioides sp.]
MPTDLFVNQELQAHLIALGLAQHPDDPPSTTLPSVWLMPYDGAPQPRPDRLGGFAENATITISEMDFAAPNQPADLEEAYVDILIRARNEAMAKLLHRQIRGVIIDPRDTAGMRRMWTMGALLVEYSTTWRVEQTVAADNVSTDRTCSYRFGCRRKILAGTTYP